MLPLISHALLRTWLRRQGKVMTVAGYDAVGGIEHALARSAEETYQALDPTQQGVAKQIFLRLTALGEGTEDTKRRVTRDELDPDEPNTAVVLATLAGARLITLGVTVWRSHTRRSSGTGPVSVTGSPTTVKDFGSGAGSTTPNERS